MKKFLMMGLAGLLMAVNPAFAADPYWQPTAAEQAEQSPQITVYRSPACGCCKAWISHLEEYNFQVTDIVRDDMSQLKQTLGVPSKLASCHTAVIGDKVIEGHVPARDIKALLASPDSDVRLLTAPGMPAGSPGMDTPGIPKHEFSIYALTGAGKLQTFSHYADY